MKINGYNYRIIKRVKIGNNGKKYIAIKNGKKVFIKQTRISEIKVEIKGIPKRYEVYENNGEFTYIYEYIEGIKISKIRKLDIEILKKIISLFKRIMNKGYFIKDLNFEDFIIDNKGDIYLVDIGSLEVKSTINNINVIPYTPEDFAAIYSEWQSEGFIFNKIFQFKLLGHLLYDSFVRTNKTNKENIKIIEQLIAGDLKV